MTRIISGTVGGRRIAVPPKGTRPTTDRVREAIFSRLDHENRLRGVWVLDAFAGSGALGLEALSRGASRATLVESDAAAIAVIRANVQTLGLAAETEIVRDRVLPWLARSARPVDLATFDLAFLDPPYDLPPTELAAILTVLVPRLTPGAAVVVEWSSRAEVPAWPSGLAPTATRKYGETTVHYAVVPGDDAPAELAPPTDSLDS